MFRKLFLLCVAVGILSAPAYAYEKGDILLGVAGAYSPLEVSSGFGEVYVEDATRSMRHDAKIGHPGLGAEVSVLHVWNPHFALGFSYEYQYFGVDLSSGWEVNTSSQMHNFMLASRVFLNPQSTWKVYLPLAVGAARTDMTVDFGTKEHFRYTGFAYHFGLGVQRELSDRLSLGFEMRYNGNRFHDEKVSAAGHALSVYDGANHLSGLLRLTYCL